MLEAASGVLVARLWVERAGRGWIVVQRLHERVAAIVWR